MRIVLCLTALLMLASARPVLADPLSYVGGTYTQNFDGLPTSDGFFPPTVTIDGRGPHDFPTTGDMASSGMEGWTMSNFDGSADNTQYRAHAGELAGSNGRGVVSFGTDNSSDRALGTLATSNQISRFGVAFVNNTGVTLNQISLDFVGEQWRRGDDESPANQMHYDFGIAALVGDNINTEIFTSIGSFAAPTVTGTAEVALDGNDPTNQVPVSEVINNVNWTPGSTLFLRWTGEDLGGQDDGLGIDNLSFSAAVPEPTSLALVGLAICGLGCGLRRRK